MTFIFTTFNPLFLNLASTGKRYYSIGSPLVQGFGPDGTTPLSEYLSQMMTGLLLSDGTLVKKYVGGGTYFQFAQSIIHTPFILLVHSVFYLAGVCHMTEPTLNLVTVNGKKYSTLSFSSMSLIE
jgi:hypothetical protein